MAFTIIKSFSEIASKFDGFILDQFGVMHNGTSCLPGSTECVKQLAARGKKLIILSNTSSPSETAMNKLPKLGFDPYLFVGVVTSGEEASRYIRHAYGNDPQNVKKALWFTWEEPEVPLAFLSKCGHIDPTVHVEEADFVITHGCKVVRGREENENISLGSYMETADLSVISPILEQCAKRGLPMVCANPDLVVKLPGDVTAHMPGKIALLYQGIGGSCEYFGKPHAQHFKACLRELGLDASRVAHVGDSLHHDIAGANDAGISSVFISGGIHMDDLDTNVGDIPSESALKELFEREGHVPTFVAPLLRF
mmetsp:Transcript_538/g.941  ORF Transcript_538/g.941 Transcript_538/m.941 type:complete len:310 (+) Transcript_538:91-1020(+)